ncbi:mitochondrial ribosomal protein subunit S18 [Mycena pura]|uniref:Mitochondrial ribosomal protein subunit S18 n=1 Tax=Mycena pura TaxID=153505 RepID=A0AAD6YTL3_9AGAR|nr:mitochondrial ribosomal protein subunit S18 [Mycena pura]
MFALCRSPLRLAARAPFLRPPASAVFSDQAPYTRSMADLLESLPSENPEPPPASMPWDYREPPEKETDPPYRLHCHSTRTNTINTFADPDGNVLAWFSGGSCGFKKRNRSTYEAGYQCAVRMFDKIAALAEEKRLERPLNNVDLFTKGFGQGRDALFKALMTAQGDTVRTRIVSITDRTPIKIGGTRAKKRKRR